MTGLPIRDIAVLDLSHSGLIRFTCGCLVLSEDYRDRAVFWHRREETHPVTACCHQGCSMRHRCGTTAIDGTGSHRGLCGPLGPEKPVAPVQAPTPDSPPAIPQPVRMTGTWKPRQKPVKPAPKPVLDDSLDESWDGLLNGPTPVGARR
jgi:hypothetical protein